MAIFNSGHLGWLEWRGWRIINTSLGNSSSFPYRLARLDNWNGVSGNNGFGNGAMVSESPDGHHRYR
jgi:hypothetical protein